MHNYFYTGSDLKKNQDFCVLIHLKKKVFYVITNQMFGVGKI